MRHLLSIDDLSTAEIKTILASATAMKKALKEGAKEECCSRKTLAMIFEKDSLRTRLSFEVGMTQMGGHAIHIGATQIKMRERESIEDIAQVTSRFVDIVMIRTFAHKDLEDFAANATVPVINGLTDGFHPCQALADILTAQEHFGSLDNIKMAYVGDGNNVSNSLALICHKLDIPFAIATPKGYELDCELLEQYGVDTAAIFQSTDVKEVAQRSNILYSDVWTSMGQEAEKEQRLRDFEGYQINSDLVNISLPGTKIMHCLPAHRGEEISAEAMDSDACIVYDQAENRLHAQKAVIRFLLEQQN